MEQRALGSIACCGLGRCVKYQPSVSTLLNLLIVGHIFHPWIYDISRSLFKNWANIEHFRDTRRPTLVRINHRFKTMISTHGYFCSPTKLLNYMTAPDTIIWSALLASAAVPGILNPVVLMQKLRDGQIVPWNWGSKFKDGSLRYDSSILPLPLD